MLSRDELSSFLRLVRNHILAERQGVYWDKEGVPVWCISGAIYKLKNDGDVSLVVADAADDLLEDILRRDLGKQLGHSPDECHVNLCAWSRAVKKSDALGLIDQGLWELCYASR